MNRRGPVARVTRGSSGPALPRRVSHGDVTIYCQSWTGLWPVGQRHQRVQPVPVPPVRCCLAPASSFAVPFLSLGLHSAQLAGSCRSHLLQVSQRQWGMKLIRAWGTTGHRGHYFSKGCSCKSLAGIRGTRPFYQGCSRAGLVARHSEHSPWQGPARKMQFWTSVQIYVFSHVLITKDY